MRIYELIFIIKPDLPQEEVDQLVETVESSLTESGATIDKVDKWGKKRLAYRVQKFKDGYYVLIQYSLESTGDDVPHEIERRLRVAEPVIKYMTIRIDEDIKRLEKLQAKRAKRAAKKPASDRPSGPSRPSTPGRMPGAPSDDAKPPAAEAEPPTAEEKPTAEVAAAEETKPAEQAAPAEEKAPETPAVEDASPAADEGESTSE